MFWGKWNSISQSFWNQKESYILDTYKLNQNKVKIELSSCDVEKFSGFIILRNSRENKTRQEFVLINIVYQPVKHFKQKINCYFTNMLSSI